MHLLNAQTVHPLVKIEKKIVSNMECGIGYENEVKIVYHVQSHNSHDAPLNIVEFMGKCHGN